MADLSQERFEYFSEIESLYLTFRKNEDGFMESWMRFKKNSKKFIIMNHADAQFFADCEKFTKLIIKTRSVREELEKKWDDLVSKERKIREKRQ